MILPTPGPPLPGAYLGLGLMILPTPGPPLPGAYLGLGLMILVSDTKPSDTRVHHGRVNVGSPPAIYTQHGKQTQDK